MEEYLDDNETIRENRLNTLVDLQKFLADELEGFDKDKTSLSRAFRPLTDGLGLEPPRRKPASEIRPSPAVKVLLEDAGGEGSFFETPSPPPDVTARSAQPNLPALEALFTSPRPSPTLRREEEENVSLSAAASPPARLESALTAPAPEESAPVPAFEEKPEENFPPPSFLRRVLAALIDDAFIGILWVGGLLLTANLISGGTLSAVQLFRELSRPLFLRFAALEFAAVWLSYFAFCLGLLDSTFGMWVWGIRISYGDAPNESRFARKITRIILGFFFLAPLLPSVMLLFRVNGRNILDKLSGTSLYCAAP